MATYTNRPIPELMAAISNAADTVIRQEFPVPEYTLEEIANGLSKEMKQCFSLRERCPKNAAHVLAENPELLAQIETELGSVKKFGFAGSGDNALVLTYDNETGNRQILRITTASESAFPNSQHVLQPYKQYSVGNLAVQHSDIALSIYSIIDDNRRPKDGLINHNLLSQSEANDLAQHLQEKLYLDGLYFHDNHVDNVAIMADGRLVTPDPGAVFTTEQHQQYLATLDDDLRIRKTQQWEAVAERAASNQHLHKKGMGAVGLLMSAGVVLASGVAEASNTQGGLDEKAKAFKDASLNNVADMLPVVNAEKAMQEGKPNEAIARLADWTPAGEPNRYLQRLYAAATGKPTDIESGMIETLSKSTLDTIKYAAIKANEGLDNLQEAIGTPTKRTTDAEKLANKQAFLHATDEIMAGNINYKTPENSHVAVHATVDRFSKFFQGLSQDGGLNQNDIQALNIARDKMAQGFDAPRYGPLKNIIANYEEAQTRDKASEHNVLEYISQAELLR